VVLATIVNIKGGLMPGVANNGVVAVAKWLILQGK